MAVSAAETVKVPQMAESISEGTLKTWLKQPGDTVQADEEVATIETDKVRFACPRFALFCPSFRCSFPHASSTPRLRLRRGVGVLSVPS